MFVAGVLAKYNLFGIGMKLKTFLRLIIIGIVVLGINSVLTRQNTVQVAPIKLHAILIGLITDDPDAPVEEPTLLEVRHAIDRERKNYNLDFPGTVEKMKVEAVETSIGPPRMVPMQGNARLHRAFFTCSVEVIHSDGSTSTEVVFLEKNAFRAIKSEP